MKHLLAIVLALLLILSAFGQEVSSSQEKANLWVYVTPGNMAGIATNTVDVSVDSAFDIDAMQLTVNIMAKGASSQFHFMQPIFADAGPMTSDAHFSPSIAPADVTGASASVGSLFTQKHLKCAKQASSTTYRVIFACVFRN